ncbi:MAG: diacylglycerol kinase family protein, partial [Trueperaceae bacterium]
MALAAERKNGSERRTGAVEQSCGGASEFEGIAATLIFNPHAGAGGVAPESLQDMLVDAGYRPSYRATEHAEELDGILKESEGLIVVAGGDGTFREVALRTAGSDRPIALLPLGTANNSARTLGIEGPIRQVVAGLRSPRKLAVDLLRARGPWGEELVVEGAGLGLYANVLAAYRPQDGKSLLRAILAAASTLDADTAVRCRVELDGERLDGEYLLVEGMNMRAIGPRLTLAPVADPTDGLLDLVLVRHEKRDALLAYVRGLMTSGLAELPSVELVQGKTVKVNWRGSAFHVDGNLCDEVSAGATRGFSAQ